MFRNFFKNKESYTIELDLRDLMSEHAYNKYVKGYRLTTAQLEYHLNQHRWPTT